MGSYDKTEMCKLVGLFLLHELSAVIPKECTGLHKENNLTIF